MQKSISVNSNGVSKKSGWVGYGIFFLIATTLGFIVQKDISLSQAIMRPIGVIAFTAIFLSAFAKPTIPLLALVVYMPFAKILVGDFGTMATAFNFTNILITIAAISWVTNSAFNQKKMFENSTLNLPILLFILWGVLSLMKGSFAYGSVYFENFVTPLKQWLTPMLLYFIVVNMVKDKETFKDIVIAMMLVVVIIGLMSIKDYIDIGDAGSLDRSRVGGVFAQPNQLGGFFVYNMFLFYGFFMEYFPNFKYSLLLVPLLICFRGIMVTFSRGAYLAFAFGVLASNFFKSKILFTITVALLMFMAVSPFLLPAGIKYRMMATFNSEKILTTDVEEISDSSARNRIIIWKGAVEMIKEYPLFGIGYGLFPYMIPKYAPIANMDAHNTYLILAAEMGIPALLIFLLILFIMIKNARWLYIRSKDRFVKAFALGMLGGLFGLLMVNMFGSRLNAEEVSAYFWIYAGLIMAGVRMEKKEQGAGGRVQGSGKNKKNGKAA